MTLRDEVQREVGGGLRVGNTCKPMAVSCECMKKPPQYCKVVSLQLKFKKREEVARIYKRNYTKKIFMTQIITMVCSLT